MMSVNVIVQRPGHPELRKEFSTSPVRVGRNPMNDLPLIETYVSEWHGAIRFDGHSVEFTDLGSTNGTLLDGVKLVPGTPAEVAGPTVFLIGPLSMLIEPALASGASPRVVRRTLPPEQPSLAARAGELGGRPHAAPAVAPAVGAGPGAMNPPTLFGDRAFPVAVAPAAAAGAWQAPGGGQGAWGGGSSPQGQPAAPAAGGGSFSPPTLFGLSGEKGGRARVPTAPEPSVPPIPKAPGGSSFNPPTLFGVSAGMVRPPVAAPAPLAPAGASKNANPPSLFGFSPLGGVAPSNPAVAPPEMPNPGAPFPSFSPPTLFGDRGAFVAPAVVEVAAASPNLRTGAAAKAGAPPTLFGVASGAIAKPSLPGMAAARIPSPEPSTAGGLSPAAAAAWSAPSAAPAAGGAWGAPPAEPEPVRPSGAWSSPGAVPPTSSVTAGAGQAAGVWSTPAHAPSQPAAAQPPAAAWAPAAPAPAPVASAMPAQPNANLVDSAVGMTRSMGAGDRSELKTQSLLRAFCDAFVDLRRGFEEAGSELGVRTVSGATPLYSARDGAELMKYMAEGSADPVARANELKAFIADFAAHQVAMMEGVNRGVRAVLTSLDPQGYDIEKGPRFMPILDRERWRQYTDRFGALLESDHELNALVFGAEFAEGYAEVIYGARGNKSRR